MEELQEFDANNPRTQNQKLIIMLTDALIDTLNEFTQSKKGTIEKHDMFSVVDAAILSVYNSTLEYAIKHVEKENYSVFFAMITRKFNQYLSELKESVNFKYDS